MGVSILFFDLKKMSKIVGAKAPIAPVLNTPLSSLTHYSVTRSKWNMGEMFGLMFHFSYAHTPQFFFEIPPYPKNFVTKGVLLGAKIVSFMK